MALPFRGATAPHFFEPGGKRIMRMALDLLLSARSLLETEHHWTQHRPAKDMAGQPVEPWDRNARSWDIGGALQWAALQYPRDTDWDALADARSTILESMGLDPFKFGLLADYNDHPERKHAQILKTLDNAIAYKRKKLRK